MKACVVVFLCALGLSAAHSQTCRVSCTGVDAISGSPVVLDSVRVENLTTLTDTVLRSSFAIDLRVATGIGEILRTFPPGPSFGGNFANPFASETRFQVTTHEFGKLQLALYSINGKIETSASFDLAAGTHEFRLNGASLPRGVHILTVRGKDGEISARMVKTGSVDNGDASFSHAGCVSAIQPHTAVKTHTAMKTNADSYRFIGYANAYFPDTILATPTRDTAFVFQMKRVWPPSGMSLIHAGTFQMGNVPKTPGGFNDEKPVHTVTITRAFLMSRTEITQEQWIGVMGANPSATVGRTLPVEMVNWWDAVSYCNRLSTKEGYNPCYSGSGSSLVCDFTKNGYRLPTEAEWEYACRGGGDTTDYFSGDIENGGAGHEPRLDAAGWYNENSAGKTHNVGLKTPNAFGLYDMHGNVFEWVWDGFAANYYTALPVVDPTGPAGMPAERVLRGGSWKNYAVDCRSSFRLGNYYPESRYNNFGFRVVRTQ